MRRDRSARRPEADVFPTFKDWASLAAILMFVGGAVYVAATVAQIVILLRLL